MNFKDFETQLRNINNHIYQFFKEVEEEETAKINEVFQSLKENIESKSIVLESLEKALIEKSSTYETKIKEIEKLINTVELTNKDPLYDIESKKEEFESQKHIELNPVYMVLKRRKNDIINKIGNLKKELTNFLKENNSRLVEEEKNRKARENELLRRQNIDLQRSTDANIKEYSELEKSLLDVNDENMIESIKKKITNIRAEGIKDLTSIKNKYAYTIYENNLEFKKFEEKIFLENDLKSEEYNLKIKEFEVQKVEIEDEESFAIQNYNFENEKKILYFEKENELFLNQFNTEKDNQIINYKNDIYKINSEQNECFNKDLRDIHKEVFEFDQLQYDIFKPIDTIISLNIKTEISYLVEGIIDIIDSFKENIISILDKTWKSKKEEIDNFKNYLIVNIKERVYGSNYYYKDAIIDLQKEIEIYYRYQRSRLYKLKNVISHIIINILNQITSMAKLLKEYQREELKQEKAFTEKIKNTISKSYSNSIDSLNQQYNKTIDDLNEYYNKMKKEKLEKEEFSKVCNLKIVQEYEYKLSQVEQKQKQFQTEYKSNVEKEKQEYKQYQKNSKVRIAQFRKSYADNILKHEKDLYKKYKEDVANNELERKKRVKEL